MNPSILFLNGPECEEKLNLIRAIKAKFQDDACVYVNRKSFLNMLNVNSEIVEESFEWVLQKTLKSIVNNGVFVLFDVFLPTRRMNQYALQLKGLPCYWLGVFIGENKEDFSKDFYDFSVVIEKELTDQADQIFDHVSTNDPCCFESNKVVEQKARRRLIKRDHSEYSEDNSYLLKDLSSEEGFELNVDDILKDENQSENDDFNERISINLFSVEKEEDLEEDRSDRGDRPSIEGGRSDRGSFSEDRRDRSPREGGRSDRGSFGGDRRDRSSREGGRSDRGSFGGDRRDRSPREGGRSDRGSFGGDRRDRAPREGGRSDRGSFGGDRRDRAPREGGRSDRGSFGGDRRDRSPREGGRSDRGSFGGDRRDRSPREGGRSDRGSFGGDRRDRSSREGGRSDRGSFGGDRRDRSSREGGRSDRGSFGGDRRDRAPREGGRSDRGSFGGDRRDRSPREGGRSDRGSDRRSFGGDRNRSSGRASRGGGRSDRPARKPNDKPKLN